MNYGERISKLRQTKNITQKELASKLYVTDKTISSWESNRTEPSLEMIIKLFETLECNVNYLLYGDNSKNNIEMEIKIKLVKEEYERKKLNIKEYYSDSNCYKEKTASLFSLFKSNEYINGKIVSELDSENK